MRLVALALHRVARLADEVGVGGTAGGDGEVAGERPGAAAGDEPADREPGDQREEADQHDLHHDRPRMLRKLRLPRG